jgi:hypothetical protein
MRLAALLLLIPLLSGCTLGRRHLELEVSRLEDRMRSLREIEAELADPDFPPGSRDVELFLGYDLFNQVLAAADGLRMPLPDAPDVVLGVDTLRIEPVDGMAQLRVAAFATRGALRLEVVARAQLVIDGTTQPPTARVRVQEIAPVFSWRCLRLARWSLARKVATVEADELALNRLRFPLPIEHVLALDVPAVDERFQKETRDNGSWVRGRITRDAIHRRRVLTLDRTLLLRDGLHLFGSVVEEPAP